jgi:hypothetical protein
MIRISKGDNFYEVYKFLDKGLFIEDREGKEVEIKEAELF